MPFLLPKKSNPLNVSNKLETAGVLSKSPKFSVSLPKAGSKLPSPIKSVISSGPSDVDGPPSRGAPYI